MHALRAFLWEATDEEIARIREACDALVLARSESPRDRHAMTEAIVVLADLAERGAISRELAVAMVDDIGRCAAPKASSSDDDDTTPLAA
jgi:hypothetical protein